MKKSRNVDEVIIEVLRGGEKSIKQLNILIVEGKKIPYSTYNRHLKKLVKRGRIIPTGYRLSEPWEKEADLDEVYDCIKQLKEINDKDLLNIRLRDLKRLCDGKRIAHHGNVLTFIEDSIFDPKYSDPELLSILIRCLYTILLYERKREVTDGAKERIINRITGNIKPIKQILKNRQETKIIIQSLFFLAETGEEEAVNIIFDLTTKLHDKEYDNIRSGIERALFSKETPLYENHLEIINQKLDNMISSKNPVIKQRGLKLHQRKETIQYPN